MCNFRSGTIECRDDGYLWDADCDGYDPKDQSLPCPSCNTMEYLENAKEFAESTSWFMNYGGAEEGTGVTHWQKAVELASKWNKEATDEALAQIRTVEAIYEDRSVESCYQTQVFNYA